VKSLLLTIIFSCLSPQSFATTYTGKVIGIADGDTLKILVDQTQHKIRLAEMVRGGHAWVYRQYATDQGLYAMENDAKQNKRGLWALPEAQQVPPWQWRSSRFTVAATGKSKPQKKANSEFKCEGKTKCGQMRSCEEARFYLTQCGVRRLDRDKDGIPCEKICG